PVADPPSVTGLQCERFQDDQIECSLNHVERLDHATAPVEGTTTSVVAPSAPSRSRYQRSAIASRSSNPAHPHTTLSVERVSPRVLVRCESRTAFAHGPSASNRQSSPPPSIS